MDILPEGWWLKTLLQQRAELVDGLPEGWRLKTLLQQGAELVDGLLLRREGKGRNQKVVIDEVFSLFFLHNKCINA